MLQRIKEYVDFKETLYKDLTISPSYKHLHIQLMDDLKFMLELEDGIDYIYIEDGLGGLTFPLEVFIPFEDCYLVKLYDEGDLWLFSKENEF